MKVKRVILDAAVYYNVVFDGAGYYVVSSDSKVIGVKVISKHKDSKAAFTKATTLNKKMVSGGYGDIDSVSDNQDSGISARLVKPLTDAVKNKAISENVIKDEINKRLDAYIKSGKTTPTAFSIWADYQDELKKDFDAILKSAYIEALNYYRKKSGKKM